MASLRRYLLLISAISAQTLQNGFLDPVSMYLLTNKGASSDISLLMLMQNARFGSDYGINPMLLNALLTDKNGDQTKNDDLAKLILISGMNAQYSNVDFANSLPLILMMNNDGTEENMSPLLFAAFSTRFSGQNGGPEQWALMKYLAKRDHERQASCQANIGGVPTDCKCKSKFAEFELFMPDTDEGFFDLVGLLDEVECTTDAGQPCFCCYETTGQMELIMEFMLQPQQNNQNQANSWVELFKYKQDNKCSIVNDDNGDQCYCKYKRMPMMNQNPMYAFFFNQHECRKDDGVKCTACKNCDNLGQDLQSMMPFLLTGAFDNPNNAGENLMNMQQLFPFLLEDTTCTVGVDTCSCNDKTDQMLSLMMMSNNQMSMNPMVMMMLINEETCKGQLPNGNECTCQVSNDKIPLLMMLVQNNAATQLANSPVARAVDMKKYLFLSLSEQDNQYNSIVTQLFEAGFKLTDSNFNRAFMLATNGFPVEMVKLILRDKTLGATPDVNQQESLINLLISTGISNVAEAPMYAERFYKVEIDGDTNAFFISQLLDQGKIDPFIGFLMLARKTAMTNDQIQSVFRTLNFQNPDLLKSWSKGFKYVPDDLPDMIYPGSQLTFSQMESVGIDTCQVIEPNLRFECGYKGIGKDACLSNELCCFNPMLTYDDQYANVPSCYYNLYQIGAPTAYIQVVNAGDFKKPGIQCKPLYKYGLKLPPELYPYKEDSSLVNKRVECGFPGVTEFYCRAVLGCCWDENTYGMINEIIPQCYTLPADAETVLPETPKNEIPTAYQPTIGTCNTNFYQIPQLFDDRKPCFYSDVEASNRKVDPLSVPTKADCIGILGCCWEDREDILAKYKYLPQCYAKHDGVGRNLAFDVFNLAQTAGNNFNMMIA